MQFASVNGTRLLYQTAGSGTPLVLIHGFGLDSRMWQPQWEALSQKFHVLRYDLRGFGSSDHPSGEPYTHAEDLATLMDYLGLEPAILLGCSMGGGVAIDFALNFPAKVRALVLYDSTIGGFPFSPAFSEPQKAAYALAKAEGVAPGKKLWSQNPMFIETLKHPHSAAAFQQMLDDYSGLHLLGQDSARRYSPAAFQRIAELRAPTLVVVGEHDVPDMQAIADALAAQIPGAHKRVLAGVGHLGNLEDPQSFNRIIMEWLP